MSIVSCFFPSPFFLMQTVGTFFSPFLCGNGGDGGAARPLIPPTTSAKPARKTSLSLSRRLSPRSVQ